MSVPKIGITKVVSTQKWKYGPNLAFCSWSMVLNNDQKTIVAEIMTNRVT